MDGPRYDELLAAMQRFRGEVYVNDAAITTADLIDGRHHMSIDEQSWHVLSLNSRGQICACLRYLEHRNVRSFDELWVRHAALTGCPKHGGHFRNAVEAEIVHARRMKLGFGEVGGWAVAEPYRMTFEPLRIILTSFGLGQLLGGCTGVATATFRHGSAAILRKIGLHPLQWDGAALPPYFDGRYQCHMEVLRFDTRHPNAKYQKAVEELSAALAEAPVFLGDADKKDSQRVWRLPTRTAEAIPALRGFMPLAPGPQAPAVVL